MSHFRSMRRRLETPAETRVDAVPVTTQAIRSLLAHGDDLSLSVQDMADGLSALDVSTREAATTGAAKRAEDLLSSKTGYAGIAPVMTDELSAWAREIERAG